MLDLPVPVERCELPTPDAIIVEHPDAGRFVLVDHRVDDTDLARLARRLIVEIELRGPSSGAGRAAARLRAAIAAEMTARTRASPRTLVAVGAPPVAEPVVESSPAPSDEPYDGAVDLMLDRAHTARIYDVFLGGKTNYWPDRMAADQIVQVAPTTPLAARAQRAFMGRAVAVLAREGFDQFLDIGTGIPTEPNLHQVAQAVDPTAHVVYVDNDPIVLAHAAALMSSDRRGAVGYVHADAKRPEDILTAITTRAALDLARPVAISTVGLLHFLDDDDAHRLITTLLDAVAPGSALVLSSVTPDLDANGALVAAVQGYRAAGIPMWPRTAADLRRLFLDGLDVVEPGIVGLLRWRAESTVPDADVALYGVVARKPGRRPSPRSGTSVGTAAPVAMPAVTASIDVEPAGPPVELLTDRAHSARIYDCFLGGKTNYAADRAAADAIRAAMPSAVAAARSQRTFMHRAVEVLARDGIEQFLDIGTGLPSEPNLHQIAQQVNPAAHVVYVDNDPIVLAHAAALMSGTAAGALVYLHADAADPEAILAAPALREVLDLARPVAISVIGILHFLDDETAVRLVRTLVAAAAPGSHLVLTQSTLDADVAGSAARAAQSYRASGIPCFPRSADQVRAMFLDGLEPVEPGIAFSHRWRPDGDRFRALPDAEIATLAAVARKPG